MIEWGQKQVSKQKITTTKTVIHEIGIVKIKK